MALASISALVYLAFAAVFLAIRGVFIRRMRHEKAVSRNDGLDRRRTGAVVPRAMRGAD